MTVRAFPWASLASITRDDLEAARRAARLAGGAAMLDAFATELERSLAVPCTARVTHATATATAPSADSLAVTIEIAGAPVVIEAEAGLAADVVARVLGRPPPPIASARDADAVAGAFAAVIVRVLRRARADVDVVVLDAGRAPEILARASIADPSALALTILLDRDAYRARAVFSKRLAAAAAPRTDHGARFFTKLDTLALDVPIVGAVAWAPAREIQRLRAGDVWVAAALAPSGRRSVVLASARASRGLSATLEADGRLVLGHDVEDLTMSDSAQDTIIESALDAPIVVRVELGVVALSAREWAELKPGDVIATGTRVGEAVVLRAGGAELARGELVEIDGEVGVRITTMAGGRS